MNAPTGWTYDELPAAGRRKALTVLIARWEEDELDRLRYCRNGHPTRLDPEPRCKSCKEVNA